MAKVSVLVPTYNAEPYLRECMDSIVHQTLPDLEIICINDGSTDRSLEILQEYAAGDARIHIIDKPNEGYGRGMNDGLDAASGEYIGIVEPDDYVDLHMFEDLYRIASERNLDIVKSDFYRFKDETDADGGLRRVKVYEHISKDGKGYGKVWNPKQNDDVFLFMMNTWCGIYRREFLEKHHIRHNTTPGASFQDNGFWFQTTCLAESIYFVRQAYYMNRRDNPNSSVMQRNKIYCLNEEYRFIHEFLDANPELKEHFIYACTRKQVRNYFWNYRRIDKSCRREYLQVISGEFRKAMNAGEIRPDYFTAFERLTIRAVIHYPPAGGWLLTAAAIIKRK